MVAGCAMRFRLELRACVPEESVATMCVLLHVCVRACACVERVRAPGDPAITHHPSLSPAWFGMVIWRPASNPPLSSDEVVRSMQSRTFPMGLPLLHPLFNN